MAATRLISARPTLTRSNSTDSVLSTITVEASSHVQSLSSSTPPSSAADSASVSSASLKLYHASGIETDAGVGFERVKPSNCRTRRSRMSVFGTYNVKVLSGTAVHAPRKYRNTDSGETEVSTRRQTISGDTLLGSLASANASRETFVKKANKLVHDGIEELDLQWSTDELSRVRGRTGHGPGESPNKGKCLVQRKDAGRRRSSRLTGEEVESLTKKLSVLGKRGRRAFEASFAKARRELKNLADTNEYAKIDTKPVVAEVWSNGKLVTEDQPPKKKIKVGGPAIISKAKEEGQSLVATKLTKRREKMWLNKGLYAGQEARDLDWFRGKTDLGKIKYTEYKPNGLLPLPMGHGQRILHLGRNFKLPFDICSPLPPGQPKPDEWRKVPKSKVPTPLRHFSFRANEPLRSVRGRCCRNLEEIYRLRRFLLPLRLFAAQWM
jgi:[histone H3]-lysine4 N-trimethyltransferase ASH1L